jgi:hypothetical protein
MKEMRTLEERLDALDWSSITASLHAKGYAHLTKIVDLSECHHLRQMYSDPTAYRKTVVMERHRFGLGEYKYFKYPLPDPVQTLRETLYNKLAPVATQWMKALNVETSYPPTLSAFSEKCHASNQTRATPLILRYGPGGFNTLHQDLYGDVYFPIQAVVMLSDRESEYTGGEFILTEQIPRAQSKAIVLTPAKGDVIIFTTNFRPALGTRGYYRINMKHGISEVKSGERFALGIIFHDATS